MREKLEEYIKKLGHELSDVRIRAANNLHQKLEIGICSVSDVLQDATFMPNIISVLQSNSTPLRMQGINLLHIILQDPRGRFNFESLGGIRLLNEMKLILPTHLEEKVHSLLKMLYNHEGTLSSGEMNFESVKNITSSWEGENDSTDLHISERFPDPVLHNSVKPNGFDADDSCVSEKESPSFFQPPILFTSFPWVPLTNIDLRVLDSTGQSLANASDEYALFIIQSCQSTLFKDFPIEVFLQRPFILKVFLGYLSSNCDDKGSDSWRLQASVCLALSAFLNHLVARFKTSDGIRPFTQGGVEASNSSVSVHGSEDILGPYRCCSISSFQEDWRTPSLQAVAENASVETLHESDDSNEFMVLKIHQLTLIEWCCQLLLALFELLKKPQSRLASGVLTVASRAMRVLRACISPTALWYSVANNPQSTQHKELHNISHKLLQSLRIVSSILARAYEQTTVTLGSSDSENVWDGIRFTTRVFVQWIRCFSPSRNEYDMVFGREEIEALKHLLSDPCFYLEFPDDHSMLLAILRGLEEEIAAQVDVLIQTKKMLQVTKLLLETSSSEVDAFLERASAGLPLLTVHKSRVFVEKVVRGLAKQASVPSQSPLNASRGRSLLLRLLSHHDPLVKVLGFNAVKNLVSESIGVSQASQTSRSRSSKVLLFLQPLVINHLVFYGCSDAIPEVVEASRTIILSLIRGNHLMTEEVLERAMDCFLSCLLNLQNLAESKTHLGRAILTLPDEISKRRSGDDVKLLRIQFYLKGLLSRDLKLRQESLRSCLALLVTSSVTDYFPVPTSRMDLERDADLLVVEYPIEVFSAYPTDGLDRNAFKKVLEVLSTQNTAPGVVGAAWTQMTFLLRNPALHSAVDAIWPLQEAACAFVAMMKVKGDRSAHLQPLVLPSIIEVLRLRASFSPSVRSFLSDDPDFLLLLLRAAVCFMEDDRIQKEVSLLLSLLLNEEVLLQKKSPAGEGVVGTLSLPSLVSSCQHVPFLHSRHSWATEEPLTTPLRTLLAMATDGEESLLLPRGPLSFMRVLWPALCVPELKDLAGRNLDFAAAFSSRLVLTTEEEISLRNRFCSAFAFSLLTEAQNATSHRQVKRCANQLHALLVAVAHSEDKTRKILQLDGWVQAFPRFLLTAPMTALDRQILFHILTLLSHILSSVANCSSGEKGCLCCPLIYLLVEEFSKGDSVLSTTLKEVGSQHFSCAAQDLVQTWQLLDALLDVLSRLFHLSHWSCFCRQNAPSWPDFGANVAKVLAGIVRKCKAQNDYNLNALVPTMEVLVHCLKTCKEAARNELSLHLIPLLVDLLMSFHVGRGRAHNAFLGRAVSVRTLLALAFVVANQNSSEANRIIESVREEVPSLPWLRAALEHGDHTLMAAGLKVAIALSITSTGSRCLDEAFERFPGGIWTMALRYFANPDFGGVVRVSCARLLLNLAFHVITLPEKERPWKSLSLTDTITKVTATQEDALIELLRLFKILGIVRQMLTGVRPATGLGVEPRPPLTDMEELKEFVTLEESEWATSDQLEDENLPEETYIEEFPALLEAILLLLISILQICPREARELLVSDGIGRTLLKQFGLLTDEVAQNEKWNSVLETGFRLLGLMGRPFSHNTHLSPLVFKLLSTQDLLRNPSLETECFLLLSRALSDGGWGCVRVLELLRENPSPAMSVLLRSLHVGRSSPCRGAALTFVGCLCKAVVEDTPHVYANSLRSLLDSPLKIHSNKKTVCPGWEICRHLMQLLPTEIHPNISSCYSEQFSEKETSLKLILEVLKLLLMVSKSGRSCAYFEHISLLKLLSFALSNLQKRILKFNIHITSNMMTKKELSSDILFATHCLQVATNWIADAPIDPPRDPSSDPLGIQSEEGVPPDPRVIGETLIPELHPLWLPALRTPPFAEAVINFLISASSHAQVCPVLVRTSVLPGALLSNSKTRNSLLVSVTWSVARLLHTTKAPQGGRCDDGCVLLPKSLIEDGIDLIINCSRVQETAFVIVKESFLKAVICFLERFKELNSFLVYKLVQCLTILTLHKEARSALVKIPSWIKCLMTCFKIKSLRKNVLLVFTNMVANVQAVKNMLSSDEFLSPMVALVTELSQNLTLRKETQSDAEVHICLVLLWCVAANNQRCKATLRKMNVVPHLENILQYRRHPHLCHNLMQIIAT